MKNHSRLAFIILGVALVLRVAWAVAVPVEPVSDSHIYDLLAQNIVNGTGFGLGPGDPNAYWAPGAPFVYAVLFFLFGHSYMPIVILNIALGVFVVAAAMRLAARWFDAQVGMMTGLILALWLNLIEFTTILASELLFCALLLAALWVWTHPLWRWQWRAVGAGALLAAACYARPLALGLPIVFIGLEWLRTRNAPRLDGRRLLPIAVMLLVMGLVIAPWSIRNSVTFGRFVLLSTNGGAVFWGGIAPAGDSAPADAHPNLPSESDQDQYLTGQTLAYIGAHPLGFGMGVVERLVVTHSRESIGVVWNQPGIVARWGQAVILPLKIANALYWYAALGLALAGIVIIVKQRSWRGMLETPAIWLWAYFALIHAVISAQDRYHMPSIPFIAMLAAYTMVYVVVARRRGRAAGAVESAVVASTPQERTERAQV
jgi:hypothetical protein